MKTWEAFLAGMIVGFLIDYVLAGIAYREWVDNLPTKGVNEIASDSAGNNS